MVRMLLMLPVCLCFSPQQRTAAVDAPGSSAAPEVRTGNDARPTPERFSQLLKEDVVTALAACVNRYRSETTDMTFRLVKQERIADKLRKVEEIDCWFREEPFSVRMEWRPGSESEAAISLFVAGEHNDEILVRPSNAFKYKALRVVGKHYVGRPPTDREVRDSSRYTIHEFGIGKGMERTYAAWRAAKQAGVLKWEYLGERPVTELDGRICHVIHRTVDPPEDGGMTDLTIMIDKETWLQTGSELKIGDKLLGTYFFRAVKANVGLKADDFKVDVLKK